MSQVERREKDNKKRLNMFVIRFFLQSGRSRINRARKQLLERSKWYLSRIMSITPQLREFQALSSIEVIPALPVILRPADHSHASSQYTEIDLSKLSRPMQQVLKATFNESQVQAISAVVETPDSRNDFDLSLVQGPPGLWLSYLNKWQRSNVVLMMGLVYLCRYWEDTYYCGSY